MPSTDRQRLERVRDISDFLLDAADDAELAAVRQTLGFVEDALRRCVRATEARHVGEEARP